jgi:hypothetical protein
MMMMMNDDDNDDDFDDDDDDYDDIGGDDDYDNDNNNDCPLSTNQYNYLGRLLYHRGHVFDQRSTDDIAHEIVEIADAIMDQRVWMMDHSSSSSSSSSSSRKLQLDKIKEYEDEDDYDEEDGHYDVVEVHSSNDYSTNQLLMSQDSVTGYDPSATLPARLQVEDLIIEKMHIHQGR